MATLHALEVATSNPRRVREATRPHPSFTHDKKNKHAAKTARDLPKAGGLRCVTNTEWVRSFSALRRLRMTLRAEELLGERRHVGAYPAYRTRRYFFTASTFGAASCA